VRHQYTRRLVVALSALLVVAVVLFAVVALQQEADVAVDRVEVILGIDADLEEGERLYVETTTPPCGACHTLAAAGAQSPRASSLDELRPTAREVVVSILGGHIRAHEAQDYRLDLSDRQLADLARYVEQFAGR
jgi:cytochrome c6